MGRSSLFVVLGFIVIFGYARGNINKTSENSSKNAAEYTNKILARNVASSALEHAISLFSLTGADSSYSNSDYLGGSYNMSSAESGDTLRFTIISTYADEIYTSFVDIISKYEFFPDATGGASLGGGSPIGLFSLQDSINITGIDTNIDGTPGPGPNMPAFTVASAADSAALAADSLFLVGDPAIQVIPPDTSLPTTEELIAHYATIADCTITLTSKLSMWDVTWGTQADPIIVYVTGSELKIRGNSVGYGIIAVDGQFEMNHTSKWYGMVLINNNDPNAKVFEGEDGTAIYGSLVVSTNSTNTELELKDGWSLYYSTEALAIASLAYTNASADTTGGGGGGGGMEKTISETIWYE